MGRAPYQANRRQRQKHGSAGAKKARKFLLMLICLTAVLACGKLLIGQINIGDPGDEPSTSNADSLTAEAWKVDAGKAEAWNLILVNRWNQIPEDYQVNLTELSNGECVDTRIYPDLQAMFDAARNAGIYPIIVSGYRTAEYQQSLMDDKIEEYEMQGYSASQAQKLAEEQVASPGTSEHQLGIAVDINADPEKSTSDEVYEWLHQNSYKYGFIIRYPSEKADITGTIYEPWHYRYVGEEAATDIYTQGICLEEYLGNSQ